MKRKVLALLLGVSMVASALAGCGSKETETTEKTTEASTEAPTEAATEAETEIVTETEAETETVTELAATEAETETVTEEVTEAPTEAETEEETEAVTEAVTELAATEAATEAETEEVTEAATEAETEEVTEAATEAETEEVTEAATETVTEEVTEAATETATETVTEEVTETEAETEADIEYSVTLGESVTGTLADMGIEENDIVVLYDNDVHGGISSDKNYSGSDTSLGYAGLAAVKAEVSGITDKVTTVDLGDAIQGSVVTTESNGKDAMDLMAKIGYDILVPGNHEFDYGMEEFLSYAESADGVFISSNFIDTVSGESIFDGYTVIPYDVDGTEINVGYVGMSTPETIAKSTPTYFQDEDGNYIYGFSAETPDQLYDTVQASIDAAKEDGADVIVAVGHMGDRGVESDWSSISVVANTTGIDVFLDGHAHNVIPGEVITDKEGNDVILSSTGTKLNNIGVLKLSVGEDGEVTATTGLVDELTEEELASDAYAEMDEAVQEIQAQYEYLFVKVGSMDFDLVIYDPETGDRLVRVAETNMGDFLSDAYRIQGGADIGFLNGGSIRANIDAGDIVYMDLITVMPWNSETGVIEVTGQQILDCLEMGAHLYPEECGGFIQPSGLTYTIDTTIPSSVNVNSDGEFVSVDGEYRVKDVMVGDEPLKLDKTYTLAINKYYSQEYGDGMTMFKGSKVIDPADGEEWRIDHDAVIDYLAFLGDKVGDEYADPYGQGRITLITEEAQEEPAQTETEEATEEITEAVTETVTEAAAETETEAETK